MNELQQLHSEWHRITGEDMPQHIADLHIATIRRAVELRRKGITVGVLKPRPIEVESDTSSLMDWDRQDEKNGNAYGS